MSAPTVERLISEQTLADLGRVKAFVEAHHRALMAIVPQVRRGLAHPGRQYPLYEGLRLWVSVPDGDEFGVLTDLIVAARLDRLPVEVDWSGSWLWVDVRFGAVELRVQDRHTTVCARGILEHLVACPLGDVVAAAKFDKAVKVFMHAHRQYQRAFENPAPAPDAESLFGRARAAWLEVSAGVTAGRGVGLDVMDAGDSYEFPCVAQGPVAERAQDWSRGRR